MLDELKEKAKALLFGRQRAYQLAFGGEAGKDVLSDLAKFCRANESTFHADPHIRCQLDGRREVWLRIQNHLNLSSDQLWDIYERKLDA